MKIKWPTNSRLHEHQIKSPCVNKGWNKVRGWKKFWQEQSIQAFHALKRNWCGPKHCPISNYVMIKGLTLENRKNSYKEIYEPFLFETNRRHFLKDKKNPLFYN